MKDPFILKFAKNKAILSELVLNNMDAINRYRNKYMNGDSLDH